MDCLLTRMSEMIDLHSSTYLKEIPREGKLKLSQKGIVWESRARFGNCIWGAGFCPTNRRKTKSKRTGIIVPKEIIFCKFYLQSWIQLNKNSTEELLSIFETRICCSILYWIKKYGVYLGTFFVNIGIKPSAQISVPLCVLHGLNVHFRA